MENLNYLNEEWRDIKGYEGLYQISNYGKVKSLGNNKYRKEKILTQRTNNSGYLMVMLSKQSKRKLLTVHRLVATAFVPNPNNYKEVNHKDENKLNNFVFVNEDGTVDLEKSNLEWCSHSYNNSYGTKRIRNRLSKSKVILQYDLKGNFIKKWENCMEAQKHYSKTNSGRGYIRDNKIAYGYLWKAK